VIVDAVFHSGNLSSENQNPAAPDDKFSRARRRRSGAVERDPVMTNPALIARIEARLARVTEPCSLSFSKPISIVEMGLIERIDVRGDHAEISSVEGRQTLDQLWMPDQRCAA
jgi:hypothetical protein